ncbi:probable WRKY transcription factor 3 [Impatiens glandulifera]|uniref:probable WRKY transcription factor 3 n=1 Tax=Impatiens glandulifera TaxID=253017 RepID=UPI001FB19E25|nr:probable WRKY transcription factor 3 [Impatiens glandulifera]
MADKKKGSAPPHPPVRPLIKLPSRSSIENLFTGAPGISPGPMTLVSNFFSDTDPDSDCRSFSQLLAGTSTSPNFPPPQPPPESKFRNTIDGPRPSGLMVSQSPSSSSMFTIPSGLSPGILFDSSAWFSSSSSAQGQFGIPHQQPQALTHSQPQYPSSLLSSSLSNAVLEGRNNNSKDPPLEFVHADQRSQQAAVAAAVTASLIVDKPAEDGYNWRKYGQKNVKGSDYPRSYYKCTHPDCQVKKKVERCQDGQVTEIIYRGKHNHNQPINKRGKDAGNTTNEISDFNRTLAIMDHESSQAISSNSDETSGGRPHEDEPDAKRRNMEMLGADGFATRRTVTEPRIIVQTTSEVDLLDDGYRWRKYGQKVVKGNHNPRSYYKCTSTDCNVRKHVERAATDSKAVITTYEGKHDHEVPAARNSSHNTAITSANSQLRQQQQQGYVADHHNNNIIMRTEHQPVALLRFKEERNN